MKTKTIPLFLTVIVLVCCLLSTTAFAWDESDMSSVVTFSKEDPTPTYTPKYEIRIPAPAQIVNSSAEISFQLNYNALNGNELLTVQLDPSVFGDDGYFHLTSGTSDTLKTTIYRMKPGVGGERIDPDDGPFVVAVFDDSGLAPVEYGTIQVNAVNDHLVSSGEYTGYLRYIIELTSE